MFIVGIIRRGLQVYKVLERVIEADGGFTYCRVEEVREAF
jgi:hypothetical protein